MGPGGSRMQAFPMERDPRDAATPEAPGGAADLAEALDLVETLCFELAAEGVVYCHWKSNDLLGRALCGESDLDLLVRRQDAERFEETIHRLGFRDVEAPPLRRVPGVFHSYGLDAPSGRLVHIHAHYELVLGDDTTKNYRLPIEDAYLASAEQGVWMPVPSPEHEFIVFVLRMVLKHATWDAIVSAKGRLSDAEVAELGYLTERADLHRGERSCTSTCPWSTARSSTAACGRCARAPRGGSASARPIASSGRSRRTRDAGTAPTRWSGSGGVAGSWFGATCCAAGRPGEGSWPAAPSSP